MATLRVWAHWTLANSTPPGTLAGYPGNPAPTIPPDPANPANPNPSWPVVPVWCELASQADIDSVSWGGPTWPGGPPPSGDQGYGQTATGFSVSEIRLRHIAYPGTDFVFTVFAPNGTQVAVITPTGPGTYPASVPAALIGQNLRGIWRIEITRQATSNIAPPGLLTGGPLANPVQEPYVIPYQGQNEGILGIEFVGDEIIECPTVTNVTATPRPCNPDSTSTVDFSALVSPPPNSAGPLLVEWEYAPNITGPSTLVQAANMSIPGSYNYPGDGASYTARLLVSFPPGCAATEVTFTTPNCIAPQCPLITWAEPQIGICEPRPEAEGGGFHRPVVLSATVTPSAATITTAELVDDLSGTVLASQTANVPFTLSATRFYTPGSYTASVNITAPSFCGGAQDSFTIEGCPGTAGCPVVEIVVGQEGECVDCLRHVPITANVTPDPATPTSATLVHNGTPLDSRTNQNTPFQLAAPSTYRFTPGPQTVAVNIVAPAGCSAATADFEVGPCPCPPMTPPTPPDDDSSSDFLCLIGRWLIVLLFGIAFFLYFVFLCAPASTAILIAASAVFAVAVILLVVWLILCATRCDLLILIWQVLFVAGVVALYLSGCCPWLLWVGIGLLVFAIIVFFVWVAECDPSECEVLRELTAAFVIGVGTAFDLLAPVTTCGLALVPLIVGLLAVILTAITLARCTGGDSAVSSSGGGPAPTPAPGPGHAPQRSARGPLKRRCRCGH